jgi:mRNA-degrading endonuclease RelE of RelBE toxin-antitoxin system
MKNMYSLKQLLEIGDYSAATTTQTGVDPETGKISWEVSYNPDFNRIFKKLDEVIDNIKKAQVDERIKDTIIEQNIKALKAVRRSLEKRVMEKYPEFLKQ